MFDIEHWHIDVTNSMSQQVDGYHRNGIAVIVVLARHILRVAVLRTKILTETQGLCLQPSLLKFNENQADGSIRFLHMCTEVYTKHGDVVSHAICVLVAAHFYCHNLLRERQRFRPFLFVFADKSRETEENICYYSTTSQSFNPLLSLENSNARQVTFFLLATKANLWIDHVLR